MGSPAHPLISAPSTTSEVTRPLSDFCQGGAEDAQHRAGPGRPSTKLGQLPTAECLSLTWHPQGQQLGQLWVCMLSGCWGAWGGMLGC